MVLGVTGTIGTLGLNLMNGDDVVDWDKYFKQNFSKIDTFVGDMAKNWPVIGVVSGLSVAVDAGFDVKLSAGSAVIKGHFFTLSADQTFRIPDATLARYDQIHRIVIRLDWSTGFMAAVMSSGNMATPAVAPSLTTTDSIWEIPLAQIKVPAGASSLVSSYITDQRQIAVATGAMPLVKTFIDVYSPSTVSVGVASTTRVKVPLTNMAVDTLSEFDKNTFYRFQAKNAGQYAIYFDANWNTIPGEGETILYLYKNGVMDQKMSQAFNKNTATNDLFQYGYTVKNLLQGDYLEFYVYQSTGTLQLVQGSVVRIARVG